MWVLSVSISRRFLGLLVAVAVFCCAFPVNASSARIRAPEPTPTPATAVLQVQIIPVSRAYTILRQLFPHAHLHVDSQANALIVVGPQSDIDAMRTVLQGVDIKNPTRASIQVVQLHLVRPAALIGHLRSLFPDV